MEEPDRVLENDRMCHDGTEADIRYHEVEFPRRLLLQVPSAHSGFGRSRLACYIWTGSQHLGSGLQHGVASLAHSSDLLHHHECREDDQDQ